MSCFRVRVKVKERQSFKVQVEDDKTNVFLVMFRSNVLSWNSSILLTVRQFEYFGNRFNDYPLSQTPPKKKKGKNEEIKIF